jgi:hypothetical protein
MTAVAPRILEWKPLQPPRGSLLGFVRIQFPSGLILNDVGLHANSGKVWASPPAKPWVRDNIAVIDEVTRKPKYLAVVDFANHGVRRQWSEQIIRAMRSAYPELDLPADPGGER